MFAVNPPIANPPSKRVIDEREVLAEREPMLEAGALRDIQAEGRDFANAPLSCSCWVWQLGRLGTRLPQSDRASAADFPLCSEKAAARILVYNTTPRERPFLIDLDQTRIAGDIGREDRRDSANHDRGMRFAADSLLEEARFEPSVPRLR